MTINIEYNKDNYEYLQDFLLMKGKEISEEIIEQRRWVTVREHVIEYQGKFYSFTSEKGSTETQGMDPDYSEIQEVFPVEKTYTAYVTKKELKKIQTKCMKA